MQLLQKTLQFIHLVKGTRVTRVKQQIFFVCFDPAAHPIDEINEAPLQGNFPYMPHWERVIIFRVCMRHLVKLLRLSLLII